MNDTTTSTDTSDNGSEDLRATVASFTSGNSNAPGQDVSPALQPFLDQVRRMDAIRDVRGNIQFTERSDSLKLKATALPPQQQAIIARKLASMPNLSAEERAEHEAKLVREAATEKLGAIRGKTGVHRDSLPIHKAQAQIAMDVQSLLEKRDVYLEGIDRVADVRKVEDPVTGEVTAEPVYWLSDHTRTKWREAVDGLDRDIRLLVKEDGSPGIIGARRLAAAEIDSAKILQQRADSLAREQEAQALAAKMVRDEQIAQRAEVVANQKRNNRS